MQEGSSRPGPQASAHAEFCEGAQRSWICRFWKNCKLGLVAATEKNCCCCSEKALGKWSFWKQEVCGGSKTPFPSQLVGKATIGSTEYSPSTPKQSVESSFEDRKKKTTEHSLIFTYEETDTESIKSSKCPPPNHTNLKIESQDLNPDSPNH